MTERHVELPGSQRPAKRGAHRLRDADPHSHVEVTLTLRGPALPDADHLPKKALSREEFDMKYAASQEDADRVGQVLKGYGLKVDDVSLPTRSMRVSGTVAAIEAAFRADLGIYQSADQGEFRGREGAIQIPLALQGIVEGVQGLDQRRVAHRASSSASLAHAAALVPLGPADLESHYNFPPGTGQGQTVAIAEFGGLYLPNDVSAYCAKFNRPVPSVNIQAVDLVPPTLQQLQQLPPAQQQEELDEAGEVMMDIEIVAGLCPQANIVVYFATFDQKGWVDLLNQVVAGKPALPVCLSVSWGLPEDDPDLTASARTAINQSLNAAALLGITICVSAGDDGSGDQLTDGRAHVDFPSSSPFVLSVGGTMLQGTTAKATEVTWFVSPGRRNGKGAGATGGGVSVEFPRPNWQNVHVASVNPNSIDGRVIPDIAALAGAPLYDLIFLGKDSPNGGTSASAPLWASLIARINAALPAAKRQRFLTPLLYQNGASGQTVGQIGCTDITSGQNASHPQPGVGYQAGPGYDAVTGWGVPNGAKLLAAL
ncbi:MAG TPA: S53 family peptidase [Bryobacteraceae bacterium]